MSGFTLTEIDPPAVGRTPAWSIGSIPNGGRVNSAIVEAVGIPAHPYKCPTIYPMIPI